MGWPENKIYRNQNHQNKGLLPKQNKATELNINVIGSNLKMLVIFFKNKQTHFSSCYDVEAKHS